MTKMRSLRWPLVIVAALMAGCDAGPRLATVTGKVTRDGQPGAGLEVQFEPKGGGIAGVGFTQADGTYELYSPGAKKGTPPGDYVVRITGAETDDPSTQVVVPPKYNTASELNATVAPGDNKLDFEITSK
jgi:hypothetical protein